MKNRKWIPIAEADEIDMYLGNTIDTRGKKGACVFAPVPEKKREAAEKLLQGLFLSQAIPRVTGSKFFDQADALKRYLEGGQPRPASAVIRDSMESRAASAGPTDSAFSAQDQVG